MYAFDSDQCIQAVYVNSATQQALVRFTSVQGMNHAWSGGSSQGSYTDPTGPNASLMIWQFFATFINVRPPPPAVPHSLRTGRPLSLH